MQFYQMEHKNAITRMLNKLPTTTSLEMTIYDTCYNSQTLTIESRRGKQSNETFFP